MKRSLVICLILAIVFQLTCNSISFEPSAEPTPVDGSKATMEDISFKRGLITFSGALILPAEKDIVAAAVFVHGRGKEGRDIQLAKKFG